MAAVLEKVNQCFICKNPVDEITPGGHDNCGQSDAKTQKINSVVISKCTHLAHLICHDGWTKLNEANR
jgi:hypothetical protein